MPQFKRIKCSVRAYYLIGEKDMDNKKKLILEYFDQHIYDFLIKNVDVMPLRFCKLIASYYTDARIRKLYFKKLGVYMGDNTYANLGMKVTLGEMKEKYMVQIGNNVSIAPNVTFISDSCANNSYELNEFDYVKNILTKNQKIIIEDDVWIGASVTILPGITVGKCSIIGAGSVITKDVESYSIYAGVPAVKIMNLKGDENNV